MLGRRQDLSLSHGHVFFAPCHNKDRLLSPHWCLNVGVGLGSKCLDLTACQGQERSEAKNDWNIGFVISDSLLKMYHIYITYT